MTKSDSKSSVRKEQFGNTEITKNTPTDDHAPIDEARLTEADSGVKVSKKKVSSVDSKNQKKTLKTRKKNSASAKTLPKKKKTQTKRATKVL